MKQISNFKEFSEDFEEMEENDLFSFFKEIISSSIISDFILLFEIPKKLTLNYEKIISNIALIVGCIFNIWNNLEDKNEVEGRLAIILQSDEPINILNVVNDDERYILYIENLFN